MAEAQTRLGLDSTKVAQAKPSRKAFAEPIPRENPLFRGLLGLAGTFAQDFAQTERDEINTANQTRTLAIRAKADEVATKYPNDAERQRADLDAWGPTFIEQQPEAFREKAAAEIRFYGNDGIARANQNLEAINRQLAIQTRDDFEGTTWAKWKQANRGLRSPDAGVVEASTTERNLLQIEFDQGQAELLKLAGPRGEVAKELRDRRNAWNNQAAISEARGWYAEQDDKEAAYRFIREGHLKKEVFEDKVAKDGTIERVSKGTFPIIDLMGGGEKNVLDTMFQDITRDQALELKAEREFDKDRKESQVATTATLKERIFDSRLDGGRLSDDQMAQFRSELDAFAENEGISPDQKVGLLSFLVSDQIVREDPRVISRIGAGVVSGVGDWSGDIDTAELNGEIDHQTALRFRVQNQSNLAEARGVVASAKNTKINMLSKRLQQELSVLDGYASGQSLIALNKMKTGVIMEFMEEVQNPESKETPEQIFERIRDSALPTMNGTYRNTLRPPYKLLKQSRDVKAGDVVNAQGLLEGARHINSISEAAYRSEKKNILNWTRLFEEKEIEELKAVAAERERKRTEGLRNNSPFMEGLLDLISPNT